MDAIDGVNGRTLTIVRTETGAPFCLDIVVVANPEYDQLTMFEIYHKHELTDPDTRLTA
jgi:hypothetical protein